MPFPTPVRPGSGSEGVLSGLAATPRRNVSLQCPSLRRTSQAEAVAGSKSVGVRGEVAALAIPSAQSSTGLSLTTSSTSLVCTRTVSFTPRVVCVAAISRQFNATSFAVSSTKASPGCTARIAGTSSGSTSLAGSRGLPPAAEVHNSVGEFCQSKGRG